MLHERLGAGGQAEVWRAHDPERGIDIALKILRPAPGRTSAAWDVLQHEYESASRLDHPYILKVFAPEREESAFLLPMELAPGGDLRRLRGAAYLAIVPVLLEVAQALEHAHQHGVIHRDLKPGNVLFDARGQVKLADFGVSGRAPDPGADALIRGLSPCSASPAPLRGEPPTPADDVYGLGALAYELLSRYPPHFPNFDAQRVQQEPVPPLVPAQQVPLQLEALIMRMLAKSARERPASMREVIEDLEAALHDTLTFETIETAREALPARADLIREELLVTQPPSAVLPAGSVAAPTPPAPRAVPPRVAPPPVKPAAAGLRGPARAARDRLPPPAPRPAPVVASHTRFPYDPLPPGAVDGPALWEEVRRAPLPGRGAGLQPMSSVVPRVLLVVGALAGVALAAFIWLPKHVSLPISGLPDRIVSRASTSGAAPTAPADAEEQHKLEAERAQLDRRIAWLEAQGALRWGGSDFATAKSRAAESVGARDGGSFVLSEQRLSQASHLLDQVERVSPAAKGAATKAAQGNTARKGESYEAAAGEGFAALGAGRLEEARAAFEKARALRPDGAEAADGLRRVNAAAAGSAATSRSRGASGTTATAGVAAAPGIPATDGTATQAGSAPDAAPSTQGRGSAAGAGAAVAAATAGAAAARAPGRYGSGRSHPLDLESQERWEDAVQAYRALLRQDRSLAYAREGLDRSEARLELNDALQATLDRPDRIANSQQVREQARALLQEARAEPSPGPVLNSQIGRLATLLPDSGKPVHIALLSDSVTQVEIPSVGSFGSFSRRDIQLRPGRYTVIGTRAGFRDVRADIVVSPERENLTVNVRCSDPI